MRLYPKTLLLCNSSTTTANHRLKSPNGDKNHGGIRRRNLLLHLSAPWISRHFKAKFCKHGGKYIEEKKLRVTLVTPPNSPMKVDLKQGLGHEYSVLKDQFGGDKILPPPNKADSLINKDAEILRVAMGHENESLDEFFEAHKTCLNDLMYFPTRGAYGLSRVAGNMEKHAALENEFDNVKKMDDDVQKAANIENKVKVHAYGYEE